MELLFWTIIFIVSLFVLIKASDYFTNSSERIGLHFGLPPFIVGVTIVAFGTSFPELMTSIFAVLKNSTEIVAANVVGSNITNIFLALGVSAIIAKKLKIKYNIFKMDIPLLIGSAFLLGITIWDGVFTLIEAALFILGIILYFSYIVDSHKKQKRITTTLELKRELKNKKELTWKHYLVFVISLFFIYFGAKYTIESVLNISKIMGIATEIIAVGAIALGTSLPELTVTINCAMKKKPGMAIGNIIGSNIFNTFAVMGIPALIKPLIIPKSIIEFALPFMLIATLLFFFVTKDKEITKWEGGILVLFYILFLINLFSFI